MLKPAFNYSETIERYRKIVQQRIVAVKEEASRKYGNLLESIPLRLEQLVEKEAEVKVEEEDGEDWKRTKKNFLRNFPHCLAFSFQNALKENFRQ